MTRSGSETAEMDRTEAVLQGLLFALDKEVHRTKLVKLTYLLDEASYRLRGQTMTGLDYIWDRYGPNAADNAIVRSLNGQVSRGTVSERTEQLFAGVTAYSYRATSDCDPTDLPLSSDDWIEIHAIVHKYGAMNRDDIVKASKATAPMLRAKQFGNLAFTQDPPLTPEEISADPFWQETLVAMRDTSERISIDELREVVAQSPKP